MDLRLLGPVELRVHDSPVDLGTRMQRALFAMLALQPGMRLSLESVVEGLWEEPPGSARATVQSYVHGLRRVLEPDRGQRAPAQLLASVAGGYVLRLPAADIDVARVRELAADGYSALRRGELAEARDTLATALAAWRGEPLAGLQHPFTQAARTSLEELRLTLEERLADADLGLGGHSEVTARLGPIVTDNPMREPLRERLALALYRGGRQAEALATIDEGRRILADQLGLDPGEGLSRLQSAVLRQDPGLAWPGTADRGTGQHRAHGQRRPRIPVQPADPVTPLVGRSDELQELERALDGAMDGHGRVVLVRGETGIGKSRLLGELDRRARAAGVVLMSGRAVQGGGAYRPVAEALIGFVRSGADVRAEALGPYAAVLGRLLPDWSGATPAGEEPPPAADPGLVLGEAVARFLAEVGRDRGCLMLLEDLQWADADTRALVVHLAGALADLPVLVVVSARDDEPGSDLAVRMSGTPGVRVVPLDRLAGDAVAELAQVLTVGQVGEATLQVLAQRSEGLPYLVEELVAGAEPELPVGTALARAPGPSRLPPTLVRLVERRLSSLSSPHRRVLQAAAVLSLRPDWGELSQVSGLNEDVVLEALREATTLRLIAADPDELRWQHTLTREVVLATLLPPERAALARRAAHALLSRGRVDDETSAAELLLDAGELHEAAELMLHLARNNLARGALGTATDLLDRVDETGLRPGVSAAERVRLLTMRGQAEEALSVGAPVLDRSTGDEHAELALRLSRAAVTAGRWDAATAYVDRAGRPDDPRSSALLADAAHGAGRIDEAWDHATRAVAQARAVDRPDALCEALVIEAKVARLRDLDRAATSFRQAAQVAAEHGLSAWRVEALTGLGTLELMDHERSESLPIARALADGAGLLGQAAGIDVVSSEHLLLSRGPLVVQEEGERLREQGQRLGLPVAEAAGSYLVALAPAAAGRWQQMENELASWSFPPEAGPEADFIPAAVRAVAALTAHDLHRATQLLDEAIGPLVEHGSAAPLHQFGLWALLRTVTDDRGADARQTLARLPASMRPANRAALRYAEAVVAGREGRGAEAGELVEVAEEMLAELPWLRRQLRLVTMESAVAEGWGDPVPRLRAALADHEQAGEEQPARICRDLLRRAGAPTRRGRGTTTVPAHLAALGVTSREMDVLVLLAEGASNAEIAERLFLSRRTVETHVANLLQRTGTSGRDELRRRVADVETR